MKAKLDDFILRCSPKMPKANSELFQHKIITDLWFISVDKLEHGRIIDHLEYYQDIVTGVYYETIEDAIHAIEERQAKNGRENEVA